MKLVRQAKLHFKEGNSDKVYEVDLAEVGPDAYVVNFRFGRRGAALKEGSKTTSPVGRAQADKLFDGLEAEKRKKGYLTDGVADAPAAVPIAPAADKAATREEAIARRLALLAAGQSTFRTQWKPSRVIWLAGRLKLKETVPSLLRLVERAGGQKGDEQQRYATLWALGRCAGTPHDAQAIQTIQPYVTNTAYSEKVRRVAGEALLHLLTGDDRQAYLQQLTDQLPDDLQPILTVADQPGLTDWLTTTVLNARPPQAGVLETLYSLMLVMPFIRQPWLAVLRQVPFAPGYFKTVRHLFKLAEMRDDFEVRGLLAYRFEKSRAYYSKPQRSYYDDEEDRDPLKYVGVVGERIRVRAELKKPDSRLAYSNVTRAYLQQQGQTQLEQLGKASSTDYVRLATAILLGYDKATDYQASFVRAEGSWDSAQGRYIYQDRHYPTYSSAMLLNQILFSNGQRLSINWYGQWAEKELRPRDNQNRFDTPATPKPGLFASLIGRVTELLGGTVTPVNAPAAAKPTTDVPVADSVPVREEPFPELWDALPQAYVQLLFQARVDEVHAFAYRNLLNHPDYATIEARIDEPMMRRLLQSTYEIPARWGVELVRKRLTDTPDASLIALLLHSPVTEVRALGLELAEQYAEITLNDPVFVWQMALSEHENLRAGILGLIRRHPLTAEQQQALVGRVVAQLHTLTTNDEPTNQRIRSVTALLVEQALAGIINISEHVLLDLVQLPVEATRELVVQLLAYAPKPPSPALLAQLLADEFASVRQQTKLQLGGTTGQGLSNGRYQQALLTELIRILTHKETAEGTHEVAVQFIREQLAHQLPTLSMEQVLRLVWANYRSAQEVGLMALSLHPGQTDLTIRQVIALGSHELVEARQWAVQYFYSNAARMRYERDEAIRLLDAGWADTRQSAMQFFRDHFTADDWDPVTLVGITDSVRPDIQAFGRELITRFFTDENGPEYLLKLSQHPGEAVQLFASNYLQRFATDQPDRLRTLTFYFRTVLMRAYRGRITKDRTLAFLRAEGLKSADNAGYVAQLLTEVSATSAIGDKATCLQILHALHQRYPETSVPFTRRAVAEEINALPTP